MTVQKASSDGQQTAKSSCFFIVQWLAHFDCLTYFFAVLPSLLLVKHVQTSQSRARTSICVIKLQQEQVCIVTHQRARKQYNICSDCAPGMLSQTGSVCKSFMLLNYAPKASKFTCTKNLQIYSLHSTMRRVGWSLGHAAI